MESDRKLELQKSCCVEVPVITEPRSLHSHTWSNLDDTYLKEAESSKVFDGNDEHFDFSHFVVDCNANTCFPVPPKQLSMHTVTRIGNDELLLLGGYTDLFEFSRLTGLNDHINISIIDLKTYKYYKIDNDQQLSYSKYCSSNNIDSKMSQNEKQSSSQEEKDENKHEDSSGNHDIPCCRWGHTANYIPFLNAVLMIGGFDNTYNHQGIYLLYIIRDDNNYNVHMNPKSYKFVWFSVSYLNENIWCNIDSFHPRGLHSSIDRIVEKNEKSLQCEVYVFGGQFWFSTSVGYAYSNELLKFTFILPICSKSNNNNNDNNNNNKSNTITDIEKIELKFEMATFPVIDKKDTAIDDDDENHNNDNGDEHKENDPVGNDLIEYSKQFDILPRSQSALFFVTKTSTSSDGSGDNKDKDSSTMKDCDAENENKKNVLCDQLWIHGGLDNTTSFNDCWMIDLKTYKYVNISDTYPQYAKSCHILKIQQYQRPNVPKLNLTKYFYYYSNRNKKLYTLKQILVRISDADNNITVNNSTRSALFEIFEFNIQLKTWKLLWHSGMNKTVDFFAKFMISCGNAGSKVIRIGNTLCFIGGRPPNDKYSINFLTNIFGIVIPGITINWQMERLLWIGFLKKNKDTDASICHLAQLPKDLLLLIISFLRKHAW